MKLHPLLPYCNSSYCWQSGYIISKIWLFEFLAGYWLASSYFLQHRNRKAESLTLYFLIICSWRIAIRLNFVIWYYIDWEILLWRGFEFFLYSSLSYNFSLLMCFVLTVFLNKTILYSWKNLHYSKHIILFNTRFVEHLIFLCILIL